MAQIRIKASQTDPFRKEVKVYLGCTDNDLCPVAALAAYVTMRGSQPGQFFVLESCKPLSRERFVSLVCENLSAAGVEATGYSVHSFRIGSATTAAACGIEDSLIQTLGRWKIAAYLRYIQIPLEQLADLSVVIAESA